MHNLKYAGEVCDWSSIFRLHLGYKKFLPEMIRVSCGFGRKKLKIWWISKLECQTSLRIESWCTIYTTPNYSRLWCIAYYLDTARLRSNTLMYRLSQWLEFHPISSSVYPLDQFSVLVLPGRNTQWTKLCWAFFRFSFLRPSLDRDCHRSFCIRRKRRVVCWQVLRQLLLCQNSETSELRWSGLSI